MDDGFTGDLNFICNFTNDEKEDVEEEGEGTRGPLIEHKTKLDQTDSELYRSHLTLSY